MNYVIKEFNEFLGYYKSELVGVDHTNVAEFIDSWKLNGLVNPSDDLKKLKKNILNAFIENVYNQKKQKALDCFKKLKTYKDIYFIDISMTWVKSEEYGMNPLSQAKVCYKDGTYAYFSGECMQDGSKYPDITSVINCLNQIKSISKHIYLMQSKNINFGGCLINSASIFSKDEDVSPKITPNIKVDWLKNLFEDMGFSFEKHSISDLKDCYKIKRK